MEITVKGYKALFSSIIKDFNLMQVVGTTNLGETLVEHSGIDQTSHRYL